MAKKEFKPIKIEITSILLLVAMACFLLFQAILGLQNEEWQLASTGTIIAWEAFFLGLLLMNPGKVFSKIWCIVVAVFALVALAFSALNLVTLLMDPATFELEYALEAAIAEMETEPTLFDQIDITLGFFAPLILLAQSIVAYLLMALALFSTGALAGGAAKKKTPKQRNVPLIFSLIAFAVVLLTDILAYRSDILILPYPTTFLVLAKWAFYILFALGLHQIVSGSYEAIED